MSATNRGPRRGGPDDFFVTPGWCVHRLLDAWRPRPGWLVEPGAGDGALIRAVDTGLAEPQEWVAIECRATARGALEKASSRMVVSIADFLTWEPEPEHAARVSTVVTNPPFYLCEEFIRRSAFLFPDADLAFLVRLGFLASAKRVPLWRELGAPDVYVLPNRPSFTADGATDSSDYAWIVLPGDDVRSCGVFRVLPQTPFEERTGRPPRSLAAAGGG